MIRRASAADMDRILELGGEFLAASPYHDLGYDREAFAGFAGRGGAWIPDQVRDDGVAGGVTARRAV